MEYIHFEVIKHHVGFLLLNFVLNLKDGYHYKTNHKSIYLSEDQEFVVNDLFERIQRFRKHFVDNGGIGDGMGFYSFHLGPDNPNLFNDYYLKCSGEMPKFESEDKLLEFLSSILIREFPNLLVQSRILSADQVLNSVITIEEKQEFIRLVKADTIDRIANNGDGYGYCFSFETVDGQFFGSPVLFSLTNIIGRSFRNACIRNALSYEGVIEEIKESLVILRDLALGKEVEYSSFVGVTGLSITDEKAIDLGSAKLHNLNSVDESGKSILLPLVRHYSGGDVYSTFTILEVNHRTRLVNDDERKEVGGYKKPHVLQDSAVELLKFSLVLIMFDEVGINESFRESGFPLVSPGEYSLNKQNPKKYSSLEEVNVEEVVKWFDLLSKKDLSHVKVPMTRLMYSIFDRNHPHDSYVDAIIAWEGMFSDSLETTFQVTTSIAKYIYDEGEREEKQSRLKHLYGWRSDLVHGKSTKKLDKQPIEEIRSEVINIGLTCLKKLLQDDNLLPLKPQDRVKRLLLMN